MGRRTYRYDPVTKEMYEVGATPRIPSGIFEDNFISPIDGSIITNQRKLHDHNQRNGVMQITSDVESEWNRAAKKREDFFTQQRSQRADRIEALKHAYDVHTRRRR